MDGLSTAVFCRIGAMLTIWRRNTNACDILGYSPEIVRKHYAKWSPARQARIDDLMQRVHNKTDWAVPETSKHVQ